MRASHLLPLLRVGFVALLTCTSSACETSDDSEQASDPIRDPDGDSTGADQESPPDPDPPSDEPLERLLIADGAEPIVHVLDAAEGETLESFATEAIARVYAGPSGRYGYAVQGEGDIVHVVDSGLSVEDHGDHFDVIKTDPRLHAFAFEGQLPVHFVPHGTHVAAFFDDDGVAQILEERSLADEKPRVIRIDSGMPHHGVALSFAQRLLVTAPELAQDATRASPVGIAVFDEKGKATGESFGPCPGVHGEAALDDVVVFGCSDGVLALFAENGELRAEHLANPASELAPAPRVGTVLAHPNAPYFVGNYGAESLSKIDPATGTITPVSVPFPYIQFAFAADGAHVLLLTKDGKLHRLDARSLADEASIAVTTPPTDDTGHGAKYPQFAVGTERVYITDPDEGEVTVLDLAKFKVEKRFTIEGVPTKLAVLSGGRAVP